MYMNMCVSASVCLSSFSSSVCLFCSILVHLFLFDHVFFRFLFVFYGEPERVCIQMGKEMRELLESWEGEAPSEYIA